MGIRRIDFHQPLGMRHGQTPQRNRIQQAEDGCVGSDGHAERKDGHCGEHRVRGELPEPEADIADQTVERKHIFYYALDSAAR